MTRIQITSKVVAFLPPRLARFVLDCVAAHVWRGVARRMWEAL